MKYFEEFHVLDFARWGIEDTWHANRADRVERQKRGLKRYYCWNSGCGIKSFDTLEEARAYIYKQICAEMQERLKNARRYQDRLEDTQKLLGEDDPFRLGQFRVKETGL